MRFFEYRLAYHARKIVPRFAMRLFRVEASDFKYCRSLSTGELAPLDVYKAEVCASLVWILWVWICVVACLCLMVVFWLAGGDGSWALASDWTLYVSLVIFMFAVSCYAVASQRAYVMRMSLNFRGVRVRVDSIPSRAFPKGRDGLLCLVPPAAVAAILIVTHVS
jgi:hypothetical protein